MSCFDNVFTLKKGELGKLVKSLDKSIPVSKLKKADLLCMYFQLTNAIPQPKITKSKSKTTKSQSKPQPKPKKQQEIKETILKENKSNSIDAMKERVREINKLLNREYITGNEVDSLLRERAKLEDYIEYET